MRTEKTSLEINRRDVNLKKQQFFGVKNENDYFHKAITARSQKYFGKNSGWYVITQV